METEYDIYNISDIDISKLEINTVYPDLVNHALKLVLAKSIFFYEENIITTRYIDNYRLKKKINSMILHILELHPGRPDMSKLIEEYSRKERLDICYRFCKQDHYYDSDIDLSDLDKEGAYDYNNKSEKEVCKQCPPCIDVNKIKDGIYECICNDAYIIYDLNNKSSIETKNNIDYYTGSNYDIIKISAWDNEDLDELTESYKKYYVPKSERNDSSESEEEENSLN